MAERTPDPVVPVLGKRAAAVALALLGLVGARHADVEALTKDQIAKTSSSNATTTRRFADASTPSS